MAHMVHFLNLKEVLGILSPFMLIHATFGVLAHGGVILEAGSSLLMINSILFLDIMLLLHPFFSQIAFSADIVLCFLNELTAVS